MANPTDRTCLDFSIAANIVADACNPASKGVKAIGYIANFSDVNHAAMSNAKTGRKYSQFVLNSGAKLYKIYQLGKKPFTGANTELQTSDYRSTWNKTLPVVLFANGADVVENIIDQLANGKFVAIIENAYAGNGGDNTFEIVGLETGLMATAGNAEKYNDEYGGGWSITLTEENAPSAGLYCLYPESEVGTKDNIEVTRAALEALVTNGQS